MKPQTEKEKQIIEDVVKIIEDLGKETDNVFTEGDSYWEDRYTENYSPGLKLDVKDHIVYYGAEKHVRESGNYRTYISYETKNSKHFGEDLLTGLECGTLKVKSSDRDYVDGSTVYLDLKERFPRLYYEFNHLPTASRYTPPMREYDLWC